MIFSCGNFKLKIISIFFISLLIFVLTDISNAAGKDAVLKWQYKLGDNLSWAMNPGAEETWKNIGFPSNPDDRGDNNNIWYRAKLPDNKISDPALYIFSIDLIAEVYLDGEKIYNFGHFDENGRGVFQGWPWHLISLPPDYAGKWLYFRVYSNYPDIGLWGEVKLDSKSNILNEVFLGSNLTKLIIGCIAVFIGIILVFSFFVRKHDVSNLLLGLLVITQGADKVISSQISQLVAFYPLVFQYILAFCYFFFPVGIAGYMESVTGKGKFSLVRVVWVVHLIFIIGALFLSLSGKINLSSTYPYFDKLYYFFTLPVLLITSFAAVKSKDTDARIIFAGYLLLVIFYLHSTLVAAGFISWSDPPTHLAVFVFLTLLCVITLRRYARSVVLEDKNRELEEAHNKLQIINNELEILSRTDCLTELFNRKHMEYLLEQEIARSRRYGKKFSVILVDIDYFKKVNDTLGHQAGDEVLVEISNVLKTNTRETDLVGRWGGEEFLIILPETNLDFAVKAAEKLRKAIMRIIINDINQISASFGVADLKNDDTMRKLVFRADNALYNAKSDGRNCVRKK